MPVIRSNTTGKVTANSTSAPPSLLEPKKARTREMRDSSLPRISAESDIWPACLSWGAPCAYPPLGTIIVLTPCIDCGYAPTVERSNQRVFTEESKSGKPRKLILVRRMELTIPLSNLEQPLVVTAGYVTYEAAFVPRPWC